MNKADLQNILTLAPSPKPRCPSPLPMILSWAHSSLAFERKNVQGVFDVLPLAPIFTRPNISSLWNMKEMHASRVSDLMSIIKNQEVTSGPWTLTISGA